MLPVGLAIMTSRTIAPLTVAFITPVSSVSSWKLSFEELTLDTGVMKATVNGAIVLDVIMAKQTGSTSA